MSQPRIARWLDSGVPLFDIRTNADAFWWGVNCSTLGRSRDDVSLMIEVHKPTLTQDQCDDLWRGYVDGPNTIAEWLGENTNV